MSTAEELFATSEPHIIIGSDRKITVPDVLKRIAVQYDHNIETVTFDCPRYWDGLDMSEMTVCINYMRPDGKPGQYIATNVIVDDVDNTIMHFDWTISRNVSQVKGNLSFLVCSKNVDNEGNEVNHWNSELNRDLTVSEGLECSPTILEEYPDVIAQILTRLDSSSGTGDNNDMTLDITQVEFIPDATEADVGRVIQYVNDIAWVYPVSHDSSIPPKPNIGEIVFNGGDLAIGSVAYGATMSIAEVDAETEGLEYYKKVMTTFIKVVLPDDYEEGAEYYTANYDMPIYYWKPIQSQLISGETIKTINGQSILGEGNIVIEGGTSIPESYKYKHITEITKETHINELGTGVYYINSPDYAYALWLDDSYCVSLSNGIAIITWVEELETYRWLTIGRTEDWYHMTQEGYTEYTSESDYWEATVYGEVETTFNKASRFSELTINSHHYPTTKAVVDYVEEKIQDKQDTPVSGAETSGIINVREYGAIGDGVTDDTEAIQKAVSEVSDYNMLIFPKGHYIVKPTANNQGLVKLTGVKNVTIDLNGSTLEVMTNGYPHYSLFNLIDCENFVITNGILKGDKSTHDYTTMSSTHEFGYGIFVGSSSTVLNNGTPSETLKCCGKISDCEIFDFTGDGIVTKNGMSPGKIEIIDCEIHHCRRQGITVLDSDDIVIDSCHIHHIGNSDNVNGASPKSGIDIEPATGTSNVNSVYIKNTTIEEISNDSIIAVTKYDFNELDNGKNEITKVYTTIQSITIENCHTGVLTIRCHQNTDINNLKYATINIKDCVLNHSICEVEYRPFCTFKGVYTNCIINTQADYDYSNKDLFISSSKLINCTLNISPKVKLRYIELYDSIVNGGTVHINEGSDSTIRDCSDTTFIGCLLDATSSLGIYKFIKCSFTKCDSYPGIRTVQFYNCYLDKRYIEGANYVNCIIANENANEISENASDAQSPSAKAVYDYGQTILTTLQGDLDSLSVLIGGVE